MVGTIPPGDLWHKGDDFRGGAASDGFGLWPKRRRKVPCRTYATNLWCAGVLRERLQSHPNRCTDRLAGRKDQRSEGPREEAASQHPFYRYLASSPEN